MEQEKSKRESSGWSWKIDETDLKNQVENYDTLKITKSYRGISVLIISALLGFSVLLSLFGLYSDPTAMLWGIVIYLPIIFFVYKGYRWAIILLISLWTFEKGYQLIEIGGIMPFIWWLIVIPYFWKALRVENERKKINQTQRTPMIGNKFCNHCGGILETNSKFCTHCGKDISPIS